MRVEWKGQLGSSKDMDVAAVFGLGMGEGGLGGGMEHALVTSRGGH